MYTHSLRHILHSSLPLLLLWIAISSVTVSGQEATPDGASPISVTVEVENTSTTPESVSIPPTNVAPVIDEPVSSNETADENPAIDEAPGTSNTEGSEGDAVGTDATPDEPSEVADATVDVTPVKDQTKDVVEAANAPSNATESTAEEVASTDTDETEARVPPETIAKHLDLGQELLKEGKYLTIPGRRGSALNAFRMVLAAEPDNADARSGIQTIVDRLVAKAGEEHAAGNRGRARTLVESAEGVVEPFVNRSAIEALRDAFASEEDVLAADRTAGSEPQDTKDADEASKDADEPDSGETAQGMVADAGDEPAANSESTGESKPEQTDTGDTLAVAPLELPPVYHVGRKLHLQAPDTDMDVLRWTVGDRTVQEGADLKHVDYTFTEGDLGNTAVSVYGFQDGNPVLLAEAFVEVKYFEDVPQEIAKSLTLTLDPTRHGPVEGQYDTYAWSVDGETVASDPQFKWTFNDAGVHRVECRMSGPHDEADAQWPAPVLAWTFDVSKPATVVATSRPDKSEPPQVAPTAAAASAGADSEGKGDPILVILGAAVIVLALSQAWMAYRLNVLARVAGLGAPEPSQKTQPVAFGTLPPEDNMEELHHRFQSHETIEE